MSITSGGLAMDVDRTMTLVKALDGNEGKAKHFLLLSGVNGSAFEFSEPERLYSTPDNPVQGISTIKALKIANDQGIPIYTIDKTNANAIIPQLQLDSGTLADIQNAINAGKVVIVSKTDISFNGWTGCGYVVIDPNTGAGAYMISGGLNGSIVMIACGILLIICGIVLIEAGVGVLLIALGLFYVGLGLCWLTGDPKYLVSGAFSSVSALMGGLLIALLGPLLALTPFLIFTLNISTVQILFYTITVTLCHKFYKDNEGLKNVCEGKPLPSP